MTVLNRKSSPRTRPSPPAGLALFQEDLSFITDLTQPASWFPTARALRRRVVAHLGPTNSGKTHSALESLKQVGPPSKRSFRFNSTACCQ